MNTRKERGLKEVKYDDPMLDGRRKLHPDRHNEVRAKYRELQSQRKTAVFFGVSRRLITFIVAPEKLEALQKRNKENEHWKVYYAREKRKNYMRAYRKKKKELGYRKHVRELHKTHQDDVQQ